MTSTMKPHEVANTVGPGLDIFFRADPATGRHEICIVATKLVYSELAQNARLRGQSVEQYLYDKMAHQFRTDGFNISPHGFYVTTERPDEIERKISEIRYASGVHSNH
jgi:hypothetical protein